MGETALLVSRIVNENSRHVNSLLHPNLSLQVQFGLEDPTVITQGELAAPVLKESYSSVALLPVIYHFIKRAALGLDRYYQCEFRYCRRWNPTVQTEDRRGPKNKYCPPGSGYSESPCSRKERYYKNKEK